MLITLALIERASPISAMRKFPKSGYPYYAYASCFFHFIFNPIEIPSATDHPVGNKQSSMTVSKASNKKTPNGYRPTTEKEPIPSTLSRSQSSEGIWPCSDLESITVNTALGMIISPLSTCSSSRPLLLVAPRTCSFYCHQG